MIIERKTQSKLLKTLLTASRSNMELFKYKILTQMTHQFQIGVLLTATIYGRCSIIIAVNNCQRKRTGVCKQQNMFCFLNLFDSGWTISANWIPAPWMAVPDKVIQRLIEADNGLISRCWDSSSKIKITIFGKHIFCAFVVSVVVF